MMERSKLGAWDSQTERLYHSNYTSAITDRLLKWKSACFVARHFAHIDILHIVMGTTTWFHAPTTPSLIPEDQRVKDIFWLYDQGMDTRLCRCLQSLGSTLLPRLSEPVHRSRSVSKETRCCTCQQKLSFTCIRYRAIPHHSVKAMVTIDSSMHAQSYTANFTF
jgi:hypothetical protein